jgi:hypothetical protein
MTDQNLTYIQGILDRSGSMQSIREDAEGGWNSFVAEQAKQPGQCLVSLSQFDDKHDVVYLDKPASSAPAYQLVPRNMTALLDAIGFTCTKLGERLAALDEDKRPASIIVVIVTDGLENSSKEWTAEQVRKLILQQRNDYGWQFIFLGADENAIETAKSYGMNANTSAVFDKNNMIGTYATVSQNVSAYRGVRGGGQSVSVAEESLAFTDEQREDISK